MNSEGEHSNLHQTIQELQERISLLEQQKNFLAQKLGEFVDLEELYSSSSLFAVEQQGEDPYGSSSEDIYNNNSSQPSSNRNSSQLEQQVTDLVNELGLSDTETSNSSRLTDSPASARSFLTRSRTDTNDEKKRAWRQRTESQPKTMQEVKENFRAIQSEQVQEQTVKDERQRIRREQDLQDKEKERKREEENAKKSYRHRIADEIHQTELNYIRLISLTCGTFRDQMRKKEIISAEQSKLIFANIDQVLNANLSFLEMLEPRVNNWDDQTQLLGDAFTEIANQFSACYPSYSGSRRLALEALQEVEKAPQFQTFMNEHKVAIGNLTLEAAVMQPCQRIPRYELFLSDIIKRTPSNHPDYYNLIRAKQEMERVNLEMDKAVENDNMKRRVAEIQALFKELKGQKFHDAHRYFVMEGPLQKVSRKKTQTRYFFLFSDILVHASRKDKKFVLHQIIALDHCKVTQNQVVTTHPAGVQFQVITEQKSLSLVAEDPSTRDRWVDGIQEAFSEIATLRDSEFAPIWKPDSESKQCDLCSVTFNLIQRRHHCRSCGALVCGDCSDESIVLAHISKSKVRVCDECYQRNSGKEAAKKRKKREKEQKKAFRYSKKMGSFTSLEVKKEEPIVQYPPVVSRPPITLPLSAPISARIIGDIINTERANVRDLFIVVHRFIKPCLHEFQDNSRVQQLFSDGLIEKIQQAHLTMLEQLQQAFDSEQPVAELFASNVKKLGEHYTQFCARELSKMDEISRLRRSTAAFNGFLSRCSLHSETRNLPLEDFWVRPLSRFFRYPNLLMELERHTPSYPGIAAAIKIVRTAAGALSGFRVFHENLEKLVQIQNQVEEGQVLVPIHRDRIFIREGVLAVATHDEQKSNNYTERKCILLSDCLLVLPRTLPAKPLHTLSTDALLLNEHALAENPVFELVAHGTHGKHLFLRAKTPEEKKRWLTDIQSLLTDIHQRTHSSSISGGDRRGSTESTDSSVSRRILSQRLTPLHISEDEDTNSSTTTADNHNNNSNESNRVQRSSTSMAPVTAQRPMPRAPTTPAPIYTPTTETTTPTPVGAAPVLKTGKPSTAMVMGKPVSLGKATGKATTVMVATRPLRSDSEPQSQPLQLQQKQPHQYQQQQQQPHHAHSQSNPSKNTATSPQQQMHQKISPQGGTDRVRRAKVGVFDSSGVRGSKEAPEYGSAARTAQPLRPVSMRPSARAIPPHLRPRRDASRPSGSEIGSGKITSNVTISTSEGEGEEGEEGFAEEPSTLSPAKRGSEGETSATERGSVASISETGSAKPKPVPRPKPKTLVGMPKLPLKE